MLATDARPSHAGPKQDGQPMITTDAPTDLTGKLLIAMPGMGDPRFEHSVVFMCAHSADGAMGIIINKPNPDITFHGLLDQLKIGRVDGCPNRAVHFGGPVGMGRGFVLHSGDYRPGASSMTVNPTFAMTATLDILKAMAQGDGPREAILALGYAGWSPGQLESEISANGWLTGDAAPDLVFGTDNGGKWGAALRAMGVDARMLSSQAGHA
jgi:putative transcriptional regulator